MEKRTRQWRRHQTARVFKARIKRQASFSDIIIRKDGTTVYNPHWFELAKEHWAKVYRTTSTPYSCCVCRGERYNRKKTKRETSRILKNEEW